MTAVGWNWCDVFQTFSAPLIRSPPPPLSFRGLGSLFREVSNPEAGKVIPFGGLVIKFAWKSLAAPYPLPPRCPPPLIHLLVTPYSLAQRHSPRLSSTFRPIKTYNSDERAKQEREENFQDNKKKKKAFCCFFLKHGTLFNNLFYYHDLLPSPAASGQGKWMGKGSKRGELTGGKSVVITLMKMAGSGPCIPYI